MSWRDQLQTEGAGVTLPWVGGRSLRNFDRVWRLESRLPVEFGWYRFSIQGRKALSFESVPAEPDILKSSVCGYLVGNRFVADQVSVNNLQDLCAKSEPVFLIEDGLDRFARISAGRPYEDGPLIYRGLEMPLGVEDAVLTAFLDRAPSVDTIAGVPPALDVAFRLETHQRATAERKRLELERRLQAEAEQRRREEEQRQLMERLGDGAGRRAMALVDFDQAARAALAVGGAEFLDSRRAPTRGERVVRFRLNGQRFEAVCKESTLGIVDAGICLTAHYDDQDFESGTRGDTWFTLESLPAVIRQAQDEGKLVIFRHA